MGLLAFLDRQIQAADALNHGPLSDFWYNGIEEESDSGIRISPETAMKISTVWKCVRWRGEQFAKLPKKIYERVEMMGRIGRKEAVNHPLYSILHRRPNPLTPSFNFFELVSRDLDLDGNFYAYIQTNNFGRPIFLWRIRPDRVEPKPMQISDYSVPNGKRTEIVYEVTDDQDKPHKFYADEILHIRGLGFDGIKGYSPIRMNMNLLGWKRATVRNSAGFFKKASRPSGLISVPSVLKEPYRSELIANLTKSGKESGVLALIEGDAKYYKMTIDPDEAQHLETMQYQDEDICGIMNVKPHKVGIMRNMTNNNVEQQNIEAVTDSMQPLCERVEQWLEFGLLSTKPSTGIGGGTEAERFYIECELKGMLRGDTAARTAYYVAMRNIGVMSANDIREEENMQPIENGDIYVMNSSYATIDRIADGTAVRPTQQRLSESEDDDDRQRQETQRNKAAQMQLSFAHVFADAVGRILNKKKLEDRERCAAQTFSMVLVGLAKGLGWLAPDAQFISEYLSNLTLRVRTWDAEQATAIATAELDRAIKTILNKMERTDNYA